MGNPNRIKNNENIRNDLKTGKLMYSLILAGILTFYNGCKQNDTCAEASEKQNISTNILNNQTKDLSKNLEEFHINSTPEISLDEIISLTDDEIIDIVTRFKNNREKEFDHKDENGQYTIIKGKKVYLCNDDLLPSRNGAYIWFEFNRTGYFSLFTKKGKKYYGIYYNDGDRKEEKEIYKGELTFNSDTEFGIRVNGK